jgi:hypothetical protein
MNNQKHRENGFQLIVVNYRKRGTRNYTNTLAFDTSNPERMNALKDLLMFLANNDYQFTCNNI